VSPRLSRLAQQIGRLGIALCALLILDIALRYFAPANGFTFLVGLALYITGLLLAIQLLRRNLRRMIWRLRNRIIVAYLFIAFIPIVLIAVLVALGAWALIGQTAVYLVSSELDRRTAALTGVSHMLASTPVEKRRTTLHDVGPYFQTRFPHVQLLIRNGAEERFPQDSNLAAPPPGWKDASGLLVKDGGLYSWAHVVQGNTEVTVLGPISSELLASLVPGIGEVVILRSENPRLTRLPRTRSGGRLAAPVNRFDVDIAWPMPLTFSYWDTPAFPKDQTQSDLYLLVHTRPSVLLAIMFTQVNFAQGVLALFFLVVSLLLLVEIVSFILGFSLTRTITQAVHNLYEGTERVKGGDFTHRIQVQGNDQLAELGRSFNGMTENLERLIVVEKEQERLKSEIAIAREVQNQLFPRGSPEMKTLEMTGVCHPARMVSGDYYDFVRLGDGNVALAIGDVAGKGISAALLMAAIQSIMRTQLTAGVATYAAAPGMADGGRRSAFSAAELVSQLNKQVYANTAPEKFATFYFGLYDDERRTLTYTNAGHLPPLVMRDGKAERLEVTGTVVGAFPFARYEERTVDLRPGDLLVAYTDGIVEPENEYGEPFGDDNLIDLLVRHGHRKSEEIIARVMETVEQWSGTAELPDDMTILVARSV